MSIEKSIITSIEIKQKVLSDQVLMQTIQKISDVLVACFRAGGQVLFCGNGGSAADAQHLSSELSGRFYLDREPLNAEALHVNTSFITAMANDYSFDDIYSRLVKAKGKKGDVLVGISTSGNSKNILNALKTANELGMITIGFTGSNGGQMKSICQYMISVPSNDTPRIQEVHILIGHIICEIVEKKYFNL